MTNPYIIHHGDNRDILRTLPDNSIDAIVTDPPYGIDFLGKAWDANTGALETYQECLRVLKPGGHILAFSAARTYHHLAVTLEQAGFEIRDQIMWIYSSGFPKSLDIGKSIDRAAGKKDPNYGSKKTEKQGNETVADFSSGARCGKCNRTFNADIIKDCKEEPCGMRYTHQTEQGKQWAGWGTQLKPAHEPICLARKPIKLSIARNCQTHGVGALNIDACRVPFADENDQPSGGANGWSRVGFSEQPVEKYSDQKKKKSDVEIYLNNKRGPMERAKIGAGENIGMFDGGVGYKAIKREVDPEVDLPSGRFPSNVIGEIINYQKYYYCPKVSRSERHIGFDVLDTKDNAKDKIKTGLVDKNGNTQTFTSDPATHNAGNNHPTVKPIELMKYLIRLITPPGGTVLDPFCGSGSTGCAAVELGHTFIGCELDPAYVEIANRRIAAWADRSRNADFDRLFTTA